MQKKQGIYMVEFSDGIKVGISDHCPARLLAYQLPWCKPILRAQYLNVQNPRSVENYIKGKYIHLTKTGSTEFLHGADWHTIQQDIWHNRHKRPQYTFEDRRITKDQAWTMVVGEFSLPVNKNIAS